MTADAPKLRAKDKPDLGTFDWQDPFRLDSQLSEDERMIRDSARAYAQEKLQPRVIEAFAEEKTDPEVPGAAQTHNSCLSGLWSLEALRYR